MKKNYLLFGLISFCFLGVVEAQNTLKVMTFNKLFTTSNNAVLDVIQSSGADIIGIQESYGAAQSVANSLGFYYYSYSRSEVIISRYPITSTNSSGIQVTLPSGLKIYVFNAHLTSYPYGPYDIRDREITSESQAINSSNRARSSEMIRIVNTIQSWVPAGAPVFFTGDFNEPSHLDWTQRAVDAGIHAMKIAWPTSKRATIIGMKDSWRSLYPNEVSKPGNTWTPNKSSNEVYDRIDIIYHRGNDITVTKAVRFGPTGDEAELNLNGYASDHRAMMATYTLPEPVGSDVSYGDNLIQQSSAEQNSLDAWTQVSGNQKRVQGGQNGYPNAKNGSYIFWLGNSSTGEIYQDVNVEQYADSIDAGRQFFLFNGFVRSYSGNDISRIKVEYRNDNNKVLSFFDSDWKRNSNNWEQINEERIAPSGTRKVRVILLSQRNSGRSNDGYFDDLSLKTGTNNSNTFAILNNKQDNQKGDVVNSQEKIIYNFWPNPTTDYIYLTSKDKISGELSIINMNGRIMKKAYLGTESNFKIPILDLPKGLYMLQLKDKTSSIYTKRIMIE
ncbi:endonuclease/exonuclease/phosphatase family protein [Aquimarina algiphila]|uniref:endonuclease/exonuclease/phosphatase family protein n=1 Tax=Aquimarina algiphila TaxID=2047982 RepID=UPI002493AB0E|nr:endonuclease/exonuclease/phosphatase family protein [Aquimarina algiphila]